jgi:hypothetical protein
MTLINRTSAESRTVAALSKVATSAALLSALYFVGAFLYIAASRINYPFALEWLEGGSYVQVHRLLTGQPLYAQPTLEYVAMIYPPLYYYAAAAISRLTALSFLPLRLISILSTLGTLAVIFLIARQHGSSTLAAILGSGLYAATFQLAGSWFDIARVDTLAAFLVLASIWLFSLPSTTWQVASGIMLALACLAKQIHLTTLICLIAYSVVFDRRKLVTVVLPCLGALAIAYLALNKLYQGWFGFFTLKLALGSSEYVTFESSKFLQTALDFWGHSILRPLPLVVIAIMAAVVGWFKSGQQRPRLFFLLACSAGLIGAAWSVVQVGGYRNDLVPAYAIVAALFGIALGRLLPQDAHGTLRGAALIAACALQLGLLWYPLASQLPSARDLAAGNILVQSIREQPGDVYVPFHPELAIMAGKRPFASWSPMFQLEGNYGGGDIRTAGRVKTEFLRAMERRQFSLLILDQEPNWIWGDPERHYARSSQAVFTDADVFWPVTGWQTRPETTYLPSEEDGD